MLLAFLGYGVAAFTSIGPRGGILHPLLCRAMPTLPWTWLDHWIARRLPPLLDPLNQLFAQPIAVTGFGAPGPLELMVAGLVVALMAWSGRAVVERCRARLQRHRDNPLSGKQCTSRAAGAASLDEARLGPGGGQKYRRPWALSSRASDGSAGKNGFLIGQSLRPGMCPAVRGRLSAGRVSSRATTLHCRAAVLREALSVVVGASYSSRAAIHSRMRRTPSTVASRGEYSRPSYSKLMYPW